MTCEPRGGVALFGPPGLVRNPGARGALGLSRCEALRAAGAALPRLCTWSHSLGLRTPISSVIIPKHGDRGSQIGAVRHPNGGHSNSARRSQAHEKNEALRAVVDALETILAAGLARDAHVGVGDWRRDPNLSDLPAELRDIAAPDPDQFQPEPLNLLERLSPNARARHADAVEAGAERYRQAVVEFDHANQLQTQALSNLRNEVQAQNRRFAHLEQALKAGEPEAVEAYAAEVLERSPYPKRLERRVNVRLDRSTGTLNVRLGLPSLHHVVPAVEAYRYLKPTDEIKDVERSPEERAALYDRVVAQVVLRSLHEIFTTDPSGVISTVALSVDVIAVDPGTGRDTVSPRLALVVTKSAFARIDLARVDPTACLERLAARPA
jgi:restriction system protein